MQLVGEERTMVFFEAPHRTEAMLAALVEAWGGKRRGAVCRELTKTYEEIKRGTLTELTAWAKEGVRGEVTLVVEGAALDRGHTDDPSELLERVRQLEGEGMLRKQAITEAARISGVPKRLVYDLVHRGPESVEK
jgi:16S rRNA (cytidine1402-2'-O)-methyltransferase